jgi:hypothetical protein
VKEIASKKSLSRNDGKKVLNPMEDETPGPLHLAIEMLLSIELNIAY